MQKYLIYLIGFILLSSNLLAKESYTSLSFLGITKSKVVKVKNKRVVKVESGKRYTKPPKRLVVDIKKESLLRYAKVKEYEHFDSSYGLGLDYKISKKLVLFMDVMAMLDSENSSRLIKSKEANIGITLSI